MCLSINNFFFLIMKVSFKHQNKEILCLLILFRISRHWACFLSVAFSSCKLFGIEIFFIVLSTLFGSRTTFFFFFFIFLPIMITVYITVM